jgi:hypothetical protein
MHAAPLVQAVDLATRVSNQTSLTPLYRSIELSPDKVRACSEHGNLIVHLPQGIEGITAPILIDAVQLSAVVKSLGDKDEIVFKIEDTSLFWKSGASKGRFQSVQQTLPIPPIELSHKRSWVPPVEFSQAISLAESAALASAVSVGLYGVELSVREEELHMLSSNTIALAHTLVSGVGLPEGFKMTLRPPIPSLLGRYAALPGSNVIFGDSGVNVIAKNPLEAAKNDPWVEAWCPSGTALDPRIIDVVLSRMETKQVGEINASNIKKFLARARVLSDKRAAIKVGLKVVEGQLALEQRGLSSQSEETFITGNVLGVDASVNYESISLPLDMLLLPLEHVDVAVFDYLKENILILQGMDCNFTFMLSGGK